MENLDASFIARLVPKVRPDKEAGDYVKEGIVICGKCRTPKTAFTRIGEETIAVPKKCKCIIDKEIQQQEKLSQYKKAEKVFELRRYSLIEDKFKDATFSNTEVTRYNARQVKIAKKYVDKFDQMLKNNQGLIFYGDIGTGKSRLSACIANSLMNNLYSVVSTSLVKILQDANYGRIDEDVLNAIIKADLVIFDDLGAEKTTDSAKQNIYYIIDSRVLSNKPMIVTTNLSLEEMKKSNDITNGRIYDRILETCYPVEFRGPSYRMKEAMLRNDETRKILEGE